MQTHEWEALLHGTSPGPWEVETVPEMRYYDGETWEIPGQIVVSADEATLFVAADEFVGDEGDEHDNEKNVRLAAAAPELAAELYRIRCELEEQLRVWRKVVDKLETRGDASGVEAIRHTIGVVTRILEGDTMTVDEHHLRDTARALAWLYRLLDSKKFDAPPPREARVMRPAPGPQAPVATWITSAEDCLLEERLDDKIPGGLRVMVQDAASHIHTPIPREGARPTGAELADYAAWNAHVIALDFPAADDLGDLMVQQAKWLKRKLDDQRTPEHTRRRLEGTGLLTASMAAKTATAITGIRITRKQVTYLGNSGRIEVHHDKNGKACYRITELVSHLTDQDD